jgi:formylglycine-generating enzyme required for sulfatase activity
VVNVSWDEAQQYVAWLARRTGKSYRLLSEAEWEYAARAGSDRTYWDEMLEIGINCQNTPSSCPEDYHAKVMQWFGPTHPVGSFASNKFGLYDMDDNVWEWMQDCQANTSDGAPKGGSASTSDNCYRVVRGGTWIGNPQFVLEVDSLSYPPVTRLNGLGARVGRTLTP